MISRRNFLSIILMITIMLFMFQSTMIMRDNNQYNDNTHITNTSLNSNDAFLSQNIQKHYVLFIGDKGCKMENKVSQWASYAKYNYVVQENLTTLAQVPSLIVLQSEKYAVDHIDALQNFVSKGSVIVVGNLKDTSMISDSRELQNFLGIRNIKKQKVQLKGIRLLEDLLISDEKDYQTNKKNMQDLELQVPWYQTSAGTKSYMLGILSDKNVKNEDLPSLIWRNGYKKGSVYSVVGNYLTTNSCFGILTGMMAQANEIYAYPVINAQNLSIIGYPDFSNENNKKLNSMYSENISGINRDIILPSLISLSQKTQKKMTVFMQSQYNYQNNISSDTKDVSFYLKQLKEQNGEAGISLDYTKIDTLKNKISQDNSFFSKGTNKYTYGTAYLKEKDLDSFFDLKNYSCIKDINTLMMDEDDNKKFIDYTKKGNCTIQRSTSNLTDYKYSNDLNMKSLESAFAYSNASINMKKVYFPKNSNDQWQNISNKVSTNLSSYWKNYEQFDNTTLSKSDARIRKFLNLNYSQSISKDILHLSVSKKNTYFIVRIQNKQIKSIKGATFKEIKEGVYLVHAKDKNVYIRYGSLSLPYKGE